MAATRNGKPRSKSSAGKDQIAGQSLQVNFALRMTSLLGSARNDGKVGAKPRRFHASLT
jgi:hypothetical protein